MVGRYNDPQFGKIETRAYFNYAPPDVTTFPTLAATADSLILQLNFDLYYYGSHSFTTQEMKVYEVLDTLKAEQGYYSNSVTNIGTTPLGDVFFFPNPIDFDNAATVNNDTDTTNNFNFKVRIPISGHLKDSLLYDFTVDAAKFRDWNVFSGKYKGLAIVPGDAADKIFGINPKFSSTGPNSKESKLILYYTDNGTAYKASFPVFYQENNGLSTINPVTSYTTISIDRSGSPLTGIDNFKPFIPSNGLFYSQGGTALVTKYSLDKFYSAVDTLKNVIFNSAEIALTTGGDQTPPSKVVFRVLDSLNHFRDANVDTVVNGDTIKIRDAYIGKLSNVSAQYPKRQTAVTLSQTSSEVYIDVRGDLDTQFPVDPSAKTVSNVFITEFIQQVYYYKSDKKRRITNFALMPLETEFFKSVSSLVVQPGATLRLYYSRPVVNVR